MGLVIKSMKKKSTTTTRQCPLERHSVSGWVMDRLLKARGDSFGFEQEPIPERSTSSLKVSGRKNIYNPLDLILVSAVTHSKTESPRSLCSRSMLHGWTKPSDVLFRGFADACTRSSLSTEIHMKPTFQLADKMEVLFKGFGDHVRGGGLGVCGDWEESGSIYIFCCICSPYAENK